MHPKQHLEAESQTFHLIPHTSDYLPNAHLTTLALASHLINLAPLPLSLTECLCIFIAANVLLNYWCLNAKLSVHHDRIIMCKVNWFGRMLDDWLNLNSCSYILSR